ncbi:MAG: hypothetical protein HOM84_00825 [Thiotrichales bacterium]|jgi:hypothetical protein|nr:hypothetical protein [Thiotrichales bacterium]MBT3613855.1 hypothetical protein [Thiotrichales bacterium]MBT3752860.1 hypothetical protein [Thiotrichales bacterium]MBT3838228.1 hypothetical protein [Thiotrichales bacterium]MBT4151472.1 hypothetical protein [Thiotrichales bacterium]
METIFFEDRSRQQLLAHLLEHWCKEYDGGQRRQMEQVLLNNLQGYPTDRLQAAVDDIKEAIDG